MNDDYLKLEYNKLNTEISKLSEEIRVRERYATTFSPIAGAWIFINCVNKDNISANQLCLSLLICLFTFIVILLYGLSVLLLYKNILIAAKYVKKIEDKFLDTTTQTDFGWERFYSSSENNNGELVRLAKASWLVYLGLPLLMALIILVKYYYS
ncbi:MAG: hypothetical protein JWQ27_267 [Ferruginibacter sp.]|nr:hypothetical protein [Ferruginibacter sp.]